MTDWKRLGRRVELRRRIVSNHITRIRHRLRMFRLSCELRVLLWYEDKLRTSRLLAESERFRQRDTNDGE